MGHHGRGYGFGGHGHSMGWNPEAVGRAPRGLKIFLALAAVLILLVGLALAVLLAVVLVKLVAGGAPPGYSQDALDFAQRNLQPLLDLWKNVQRLTGK